MKKRLLSLILCLFLAIGMLPSVACAAAEISSISLKGYKAPEAGKSFQNYLALTAEDAGMSFYAVDWYDETAGRFLNGSDTFREGHVYSVQIWMEAQSGYSFKCINDNTPNVTATLDGRAMTVTKAFEYKAWAMVVLNYTFPAISSNQEIRTVTATGLTAPEEGNTPDYSLTVAENSCSASSVTWTDLTAGEAVNNATEFKGGRAYRVRFAVTANPGYVFSQNVQASLDGSRATVINNSGQRIDVVFEFPALAEAHTHTPSAWRTTGAYHYKACTTCGDFLEQEDHKGGVATCNEKGKCTVCGYAYIETNENHTPDTTKWVARGEMYHFHPCKGCGAHCDIADHIPGPAGTPGAAVVCRDCGYVITPAKNHEHKLTLVAEVEPTCTESGVNAYYTCSGCSEKFYDAQGAEKIADEEDLTIPPQGHHISNGWGFDEDTHWRICAWCKARMTETEMEHELQDGKCTTCEFEGTAPTQTAPVQTTDPETTAPAQTTEPETADPEPTNPESADPETEEGGLPLWALLLIGLVAVAAGVGGGILVLKLSKKKRV